NATDRGPQVSWFSDGTIKTNIGGVLNTVQPAFPRSAWQHVRLDIHLDTSNYNFYWTPPGGPEQTLGTNVGFRVPITATITHSDRFSIAHFGATVGLDNSNCFYDNVSVTLITPSTCYPNCDGSTVAPCLTVADFGCFLNAFAAGSTYANCDGSTT